MIDIGNITLAIHRLTGSSTEFRIDSDNIITWLDTDTVQPTEQEIATEITRLEAEYIATQYQRDRKEAYDKRGVTIAALVVAQAEASLGDTTEWDSLMEIRKQIKLDIPK